MTLRKKVKVAKPLTEVELQIMNAVWTLGECTVKEVQQVLSQNRELAYTSVATIMKILEQKGVLKSQKDERAHTYKFLVTRSEYDAVRTSENPRASLLAFMKSTYEAAANLGKWDRDLLEHSQYLTFCRQHRR